MGTEHGFTLIIEGIPDLTPEVMDALFEAGWDDATVMMQADRVSMAFDRAAPTMKDAIISGSGTSRRRTSAARVILVEGTEPGSAQELDSEVRRVIGA